jgi:hypothetical protein
MARAHSDTERKIGPTDPVEVGGGTPKRGDMYHCERCGMALEITADCKCSGENHMHFECCDQEMVRT